MYATESEYPYVEPHVLSWNYRKHLILREITGYRPDIVVLQEVEKSHFEDTLVPQLRKDGYEGVYQEKTNVMFTTKYTCEGCATFYRRQRFQLAEQWAIEFNQIAQEMGGQSQLTDAQTARLSKGNIALCVILDDKLHGGQVCAVNTHITASVELTDVKLWQAHALLASLDRALSEKPHVGLLLCGDFNSEPHSAVYSLYAEGGVHAEHPELHVDPQLVLQGLDLQHHAHLASAYQQVTSMEAPFTNFTATFRGTLDYVWYDARALRPTATLEVAGTGPLPSEHHPSDHVPLVADLVQLFWDQ
jgi:CCR4-NOT transcription complex subunit 6